MASLRMFSTIISNHGLRLRRDRFLLGMGLYLFACAVALRWLLPWLQTELQSQRNVDIAMYVPWGVSYFVLINSAVVAGMVGGFLLLETREEGVLEALRVTPVPWTLHLSTLMVLVAGACFLLAVAGAAVVGIGVPPWPAVLLSATLVAPTSLLMTLLLTRLASNKIEAFASLKILSVLALLPAAAYFMPEPLQYVAGVLPPYWACKVWWAAAAGHPPEPLWLLGGAVASALWVGGLWPRWDVY